MNSPMKRTTHLTSRASTSKQVRLLAALAVFTTSVTAVPVSATAQSAPAPLNPSDCSNGLWVDDPENNPGLVADCTTMVAVRNHFMSNPANAGLDWASPWLGTSIVGGRVYYLSLGVKSLGVNLTGIIPPQLGNLTNLNELHLGSNLTGTIPPQLGNLTNLTYLRLRGNLTGPIPPQLGNLTNLGELYLNDNQLT